MSDTADTQTTDPFADMSDREILLYIAQSMAWLTGTLNAALNSAPAFMGLRKLAARKDAN